MKKECTEISRYTIKLSIVAKGKIVDKEDTLVCKEAVKNLYWVTNNDEYSSVYGFCASDVGQMAVFEDADIAEFEFVTHYFTDAEIHKANLKQEAKKFIQEHVEKLKSQAALWNTKTSLSFFQ